MDYTSKVFKKLEKGTIDISTNCTFKCQFDDQPEDGNWQSLRDHVRHASKCGSYGKYSKGYRTRANHKALLKYMFEEVHRDDYYYL